MPLPIRRTLAATIVALLSIARPAAGQGFVLATPDSSAKIIFGGRVQTIFNTTSEDDAPVAQTELRRVRLEATLQLNELVHGRIQPEFAGSRVVLKDAYVRLNLDPAAQVWAGQAHRPFGVISPISSVRMAPIERGVRIRGLSNAYDEYNIISNLGYSDRDVGLQLRGEPRDAPLGFSYAVGYFNGPAVHEAPDENTWQGVARVMVRPAGRVRLGASWSRIDFVMEDTLDDDELIDAGQAWALDMELGNDRGGVHVIGEVAYGDFDPFQDAKFFGAQGWVSYRTGRVSHRISAVEPLLRVSYGNPDLNDDGDIFPATGGTLVTPGVNLWLGGLNRFALNWEAWTPEDGDFVHSFKALFQLAF
ncbi:MAG TPA: porin [Longimicrobium sp.]|nr:porin [Longimicrobium sp.]